MPQILELKDTNGEIWVRIGKPGDFPSGVALWTPYEQTRVKELAARDAIEALREPTEAQIQAIDAALHKHWPNAREMAVAVHQAMVNATLGEPQ